MHDRWTGVRPVEIQRLYSTETITNAPAHPVIVTPHSPEPQNRTQDFLKIIIMMNPKLALLTSNSCGLRFPVLVLLILLFSSLHLQKKSCGFYRLVPEPSLVVRGHANEDEGPYDPLYQHPDVHVRINHFKKVASSLKPITDKVTIHKYHIMYGTFLLPYAANAPQMKMLEIGLGCRMAYGPGASVSLWKTLFPQADLWMAEYSAECVEKAKEKHLLDGFNVLVGDQGDLKTLDQWIHTSGGQFDVVIDDGGHTNCQISNSFDKLWPQVKPGGLYFIEDLQVGRTPEYKGEGCGDLVMADKLKDWIEQLLIKSDATDVEYKINDDVLFVTCIAEACVVGKQKGA